MLSSGRWANAQSNPASSPPPAPLAPPAPPGTKNPQHPTKVMTEEDVEREKTRLEKEVGAAFARNDYAQAETLLRELVPLDHQNFVPWYNLACALSMQGGEKTDEGAKMLQQAISRGFVDRTRLESDEHLANVRATPEYRGITASWDTMLARRAARIIDDAKTQYKVGLPGSPYTLTRDEHLHLVYVSAFDQRLFGEGRKEIEQLTRWWDKYVLPVDEPWRSGAEGNGEKNKKSIPTVLVLLPTREDYSAWARSRFGDLADRIGGEYSHDSKKLVAMDLGATLRHEYWHVLHWRHMDQLGQRQPLWVMEGLCSLVEDVETGADGAMIVKPSWRSNMVRRLARAGSLTPWQTLFTMDRKRFIGSRPLAMYAQSRAVFMYLHERGKLRDWYTAYVQTFDEDPSGLSAFTTAFDRPLKETERDFRDWAKKLPEVVEEVGAGPANLPVELGPGSGDGPEVTSQASIDFIRGGGGKPAETGGLKFRDVITSIDGKPIRDLPDLARILGEYEAGTTVKVGYRRGKQHAETQVKLVPPKR